ncbi:hypothetical protein ACFQ68_13295 [Amycolatopsis japonica]|uniref:hypothetical protein n=1 Tax=Amycolatopsis japonica TaxID=208439 RepID=UPI00366C111B
MRLRPRKKRIPAFDGDPSPVRDRRQDAPEEDQQRPGNHPVGPDERCGERHGLLTLADRILTSGTVARRAVAVTAAITVLATGSMLAIGIARIDIGPVHITVRDNPARTLAHG